MPRYIQYIQKFRDCFNFIALTIPGTNFIIRRWILEEIGGWDTKAITEDTEISIQQSIGR